jgi:hypothetical protein
VKAVLTADEMVQIVAVTDPNAIYDAEDRLRPVVGEIVEWHWLWTGVSKGIYKAVEVQRGGVAQYRYFYHINDQGFLNVNASVFVGPGRPDAWLWLLGADLIAGQERARGIICTTNRKGHIEECQRVGFKILGVRLFREIDLGDETKP